MDERPDGAGGDAGVAANTPAIELRGIVKRFPGVVANDHVDLVVQRGEIHAIVGENGSGKSTLMKTLYGLHRPDEGTITIDGVVHDFKSPKDAIAVGIGMVHQHFMLADNLTVTENVILGDEPTKRGVIDFKRARTRIVELSRKYGLGLHPDALIENLGVGERQRVEIVKVLFRGARILILDEPTAVLVPHEVDDLFASLRELTAEGATAIFISHKLDEVLSIADSITVIRAGRTVARVLPGEVNARNLAELMVGSELPTPETRESTVKDEVLLEVDRLRRTDGERVVLDDVSFRVRRGEIVGIAGVEGNGQSELLEAIMGIESTDEGIIRVAGRDIAHLDTRERRHAGLGYIPEDRHHDGLVLPAPLWENAMLGHQNQAPFVRGPWINKGGAIERTREIIERFDVRTPGPDVPAYALSGGNQQKLIIGREMLTEPRVLLASHPTRGIDVGAQAAVWDIMRQARKDGLATLLVSADLDELIGLSDTLLVISRGRIVATLDPATVTPVELGSYMTAAHTEEGVGGVSNRWVQAIAAPLAAAIVSLAVASIVLLISGHDPLEAYKAMWSYVDSTESVVAILNRAGPYYVSALAAAIGFKMGLFNIGVDGQYRLAALFAATLGAAVSLPAVLHVGFIILVAITVGALYAGLAGVLKVGRGVNEVISTIMLNYIATGTIAFLLTRYFKEESEGVGITKTPDIDRSGWMPDLNRTLEAVGFHLPAGTRLYGYLVVAALLGVGFYVLVWRTRFGFELRSSGINPFAARASGVSPGRMVIVTMLISGALAGMVAIGPLLSDTHMFEASGGQFPLALGFTGIGVALLGRNHPVGIALAAIVYAGIERSTQVLSPLGIPSEISRILQGTLILSSVIAYEVVRRQGEAAAVRAASRGQDHVPTPEPLVGHTGGATL